MNLLLAGVNHQTARVDLREKLCTLLPEAELSYPQLLSYGEIREALYYTTCNRVEVLCVTEAVEVLPGVLSSFFARHPEIDPESLTDSLYFYRDEAAVRHLFRVASSLDAMVVTGVAEEVSARRLAFTVSQIGPDELEDSWAQTALDSQGGLDFLSV